MSNTVVHTGKGRLRGRALKDCDVFYNVPHSRIAHRFAVPDEAADWPDVRDATKVGKMCVQVDVPGMSAMPKAKIGGDGLPVNMAEDALVVNVWTQRRAEPKPVLVWVHGGNFLAGSGAEPMYDGRKLCVTQGVVVVTLNYRLGALGFLYNPGGGVPPNLGLLDQIAALRWIQREIATFGGDPRQVTVFGQSAGAMSIAALLASPLAAGLFRGAILMSGAANAVQSPQQAEKVRAGLAAELGLPVGAMNLERLLLIPIAEFREAEKRLLLKSRDNVQAFAPTVAPGFPHPLAAIRAGASRDVVIMSGVTRDEYNLFMVGMKGEFTHGRAVKYIRRRLENSNPPLSADEAIGAAERIVRGVSAPASGRDLYSQVAGEYFFTVPHEYLLNAHQGRSYAYRFDWTSPMKGMRAAHAVELPFVFHTHTHPILKLFAGKGAEANQLAQMMMDSWGAFARSLSPETPHTGVWPPHDPKRRPTIVFGEGNKGQCSLKYDLHREALQSWGSSRAKL
eukprot:TRINITY_DN27673_c0_g1_i1.p1 TRINITY_DN27673_c0_g1~~TRINITY_DN27673_c0_g1_i1.p1  ORF type:complete len:508 (+),score=54.75 TRINITY_DN27673_c0_g1_i1:44-1567(+)